NWTGAEPVAAELTVEIDSFEVLRGEGGVKALSGPEKVLVKSNALKSLDAGRYPEIRFTADVIDRIDDGYRLTGTLQIRGKSRKHVIDLRTEDLGEAWRMSAESAVRQTDYGVKPYSMLMGSMQVADEVTVSFTAVHAKDD
ncbi:MAG TPA: YceI family protein, partial [Mycobacterium sp.]|nr:YceI family protein [Mycobacterium sp.]